jgi:excisionase family DNA binding protein
MEKCALSVKETAQALGISESLTRSLIRRQELPSLPVGRRVLVPVVALERLLGGTLSGLD